MSLNTLPRRSSPDARGGLVSHRARGISVLGSGAIAVLLLAGCGGPSSGNTDPPKPPPTAQPTFRPQPASPVPANQLTADELTLAEEVGFFPPGSSTVNPHELNADQLAFVRYILVAVEQAASASAPDQAPTPASSYHLSPGDLMQAQRLGTIKGNSGW